MTNKYDDTIKILQVNAHTAQTVEVSISDLVRSISLIDLTKIILTWLDDSKDTFMTGTAAGALLVWQDRAVQDLARDFFLGTLYGMGSKYRAKDNGTSLLSE